MTIASAGPYASNLHLAPDLIGRIDVTGSMVTIEWPFYEHEMP